MYRSLLQISFDMYRSLLQISFDMYAIQAAKAEDSVKSSASNLFCSALQCVAVCCSVLQCVAVSCTVLQCAAVS